VSRSKNQILSLVSPFDLKLLQPHLRQVELPLGMEIAGSQTRIDKVFFPEGGILSCIVELKDGSSIEIAMVGNDGVFGAMQALDDRPSLHKVMVQAPSRAAVVDAAIVKHVGMSSAPFRQLMVQYEQFFSAQVQQTAACNALHSVEARACKWLVRMHDLVGDELPLTQDFLAQMIGVQRTSVSGVAARLQEEGLIDYHRGRVTILDIKGVERRACECSGVVREHYASVFGRPFQKS
jgi:CRP-like cAMP-binding protein